MQQINSLNTVEIAQPLLPHLSTITKNKSPITFKMELIIRKYKGDLLSPNARKVLAKKLYMKVNTIPLKIIRKYCVAIGKMASCVCIIRSKLGDRNIQSKDSVIEKISPPIIVELICFSSMSYSFKKSLLFSFNL